MDRANTTNVEFIVDPKVLFNGWLIYSYLHIRWSSVCQEEYADWFFDNIMTWSYCFHRRYSMSQQKNSILINEHALNREPVPLSSNRADASLDKNRLQSEQYFHQTAALFLNISAYFSSSNLFWNPTRGWGRSKHASSRLCLSYWHKKCLNESFNEENTAGRNV